MCTCYANLSACLLFNLIMEEECRKLLFAQLWIAWVLDLFLATSTILVKLRIDEIRIGEYDISCL